MVRTLMTVCIYSTVTTHERREERRVARVATFNTYVDNIIREIRLGVMEIAYAWSSNSR